MDKKEVSFFVSYAHANESAKKAFMGLFLEQTGAAKRFNYRFWDDQSIVIGDNWQASIEHAMKNADFGLLLISPAFLNSKFINDNELPHYLGVDGKRCFPVMLAPVDFERHDLKGLDEQQIYRLNSSDFKSPRAFNELKGNRKEQFARELFAQIDDWLAQNALELLSNSQGI